MGDNGDDPGAIDRARLWLQRLSSFLSPAPLARAVRHRLFPDEVLPGVIIGGGAVIAGAILCAAAALITLRMVAPPIPDGIDFYALNRPPAYTFLDANGNVAGHRGAIVGERLALSELPPYLPAAFLAMEDRRFYEHHGLDAYGLLRALKEDVMAGRIAQGGSTITQQIVKILFLTPDRTFSRKIPEMAGALALERHLSKQQILELYLNRIYLGAGAYGVDGAARVYFGKSAREVTLPEAAMLAALTRSPSAYSPRRDLATAQMRAGRVLDALLASGAITREQAETARQDPATVADHDTDLAADYFFDVAADEAQRLTGGATGDLVIATTLGPRMQEEAHSAISGILDRRGKTSHASQAALVAMTPDGAMRAIVGGRDYADSPFNRATQAERQPGSAFKPFVYLTALEQGLSPWTIRSASVTGDYAPKNYNDEQWGNVTLDQALANSINTVAVNVETEVGADRVVSVAQRLGIQSPLPPYSSLALGTAEVSLTELTAAYASFASAGFRAEPYTVTEVTNDAGAVLYRRGPREPDRVIDEDKALTMNAMLHDVVSFGTGRAAAVPGREVAGKTGTSANFHDAWFVGYSANLVTGVWVGNDDASPMKKVTGGTLPAQIWSGFMRQALAKLPATPLPRAFPPAPVETNTVASLDDTDLPAAEVTEATEQPATSHAEPIPGAYNPPAAGNPTPPQPAAQAGDLGSPPSQDTGGVRDLEQEREALAPQAYARAQRNSDRRDDHPYTDDSFYPARDPRSRADRNSLPWPDEETVAPARSARPPRLVILPDGTWETVQ